MKKSILDLTANTSEMFSRDAAIQELHNRMAQNHGEKEEELQAKNMKTLEKKIREIYFTVVDKKIAMLEENEQKDILGMLEAIEDKVEYYLQAGVDLEKGSQQNAEIRKEYDELKKFLKETRKQRRHKEQIAILKEEEERKLKNRNKSKSNVKLNTTRKLVFRSSKRPVTPKEDPNDNIDENQRLFMQYISKEYVESAEGEGEE